MDVPEVVLMVERTRRASPLGSAEMDVPFESAGASWVWKGPRTVPSVDEGGLGWSMESTRRERPRMSERRMNSYITACLVSNIFTRKGVQI
jgi:hypothetical protein